MLRSELLNDKDRLRKALLQPYVVIDNAFDQDFAEAFYEELKLSDAWVPQDHKTNSNSSKRQSSDFTYSRKQIHIDEKAIPENLQIFFDYLRNQECLNWINEISGRTCNDFWGGAAAFDEGDHISEHDDHYVYRDSNGNTISRSVTLTYYLNRTWKENWGGELVWKNPRASILPEFNKLVLFKVGSGSSHWVNPVSPLAQERRISVTGWFLTTRAQEELKKKKLNIKIG